MRLTGADVDVTLSTEMQRQVHAKNRQCFNNAMTAVLAMRRPGRGLYYVEGWARTEYGLITEHGWVEYRGKVIETTPTWLENREHTAYFPAFKWTPAKLSRDVMRSGHLPLLLGWWDSRQRRMSRAFRRRVANRVQEVYREAMENTLPPEAFEAYVAMTEKEVAA